MTRISGVIHGWLGWCPGAGTLTRQVQAPSPMDATDIPAREPGMKPGAGWMERYRNRVFSWAVFYTLLFLAFMGSIHVFSRMLPLVLMGILGGAVFFALFYRRTWNSFDLARGSGTGGRTHVDDYVIVFVLTAMILASVILVIMALFSIIPFESAFMLPAAAMGFAFIPWYVLLLILAWEHKSGCILVFERSSLSLTVRKCE